MSEKLKSPFELFGVECGKGWHPIVKEVLDYITEYNKDKKEDDKIVIRQIKEKFGQLRIYVYNSTKELERLIDSAERKAAMTCELCGSQEKVGQTYGGWITTCCENCVKEMAKKRGFNYHWKIMRFYNVESNGKMIQIN